MPQTKINQIDITYSPVGVISLTFAALLGGLVGPLILDIMCVQAFLRGKGIGALIFMFLPVFFSLVILPYLLIFTNCLINFAKGKPAIQLTPDLFIDNVENIKVSWKDISKVYINTANYDFLKISVINNSTVYKQAKNKFWKFLFWNNTFSGGGITSINMFLLQGKNKDILNDIMDYHGQLV